MTADELKAEARRIVDGVDLVLAGESRLVVEFALASLLAISLDDHGVEPPPMVRTLRAALNEYVTTVLGAVTADPVRFGPVRPATKQ